MSFQLHKLTVICRFCCQHCADHSRKSHQTCCQWLLQTSPQHTWQVRVCCVISFFTSEGLWDVRFSWWWRPIHQFCGLSQRGVVQGGLGRNVLLLS